uniref:DDE Tnp4 domain-containing protein n=1 Tax=Cyprinus carpio TaxID=7962 RepID=A0A8C1YF42_CYPCA
MACLFLREEPVAEGVRVIRRAFRIRPNHILRDRQDPLAHHDNVLIERYCFSREGVIYIINLLEPHVKCSIRRSQALTTAQTVCIYLRFFASGTFLYTIGDAETLVKSAVCRAIRKVYLALKQFLGGFVVFKTTGYEAEFFCHCRLHTRPHQGPNEGDFVNYYYDSYSTLLIYELITKVIVQQNCIFPGAYDGILLGDAGLTRTRAHIEMTFGQLKERFQGLRVAPDITVACAVLHNIATIRKARTPVVEVQPDDDLQLVHLDHPSGRAAQDRIVEHHF